MHINDIIIDEKLFHGKMYYLLGENILASIDMELLENETKVIKKNIYLTYRGLLRALFTSRSALVEPYVEWATQTLFTVHFGTNQAKRQLATKITGITSQTLKELGKANVTTMPCVYLFSIGTVADLRVAMSLDAKHADADRVYKLGYTNDLPRRAQEHQAKYGAIPGAVLNLEYHSYIDVKYIAQAESAIKDLFRELNLGIKYKKYQELAVLSSTKLKFVKKNYVMIGKIYMGNVAELISKMHDLTSANTIKIAEMEIAIAHKNTLVCQKDLIISQKDNQIMALENLLEKNNIKLISR